MGFGGSVAAMIASIKANDAQRAKRRASYKDGTYTKASYGEFVDHKKMSPTDFAAFKQKLHKEKRAEQLKTIVLIVVSAVVAVALLWGVATYLSS